MGRHFPACANLWEEKSRGSFPIKSLLNLDSARSCFGKLSTDGFYGTAVCFVHFGADSPLRTGSSRVYDRLSRDERAFGFCIQSSCTLRRKSPSFIKAALS